MAVSHDQRSPVIMNAAGDALSSIFQGRDMKDTTPQPRLQLTGIQFTATAGGGVLTILNNPGGGILFQSPVLGVGESFYMELHNKWIQNAVCAPDWIAGNQVFLHYV